MNTEQNRDTVTSLVSRTLVQKKRATVKDIETILKTKGYKPQSAYGCLRRLSKYGFAIPRENGQFEAVATLGPTQDSILKGLERKSRRRTARATPDKTKH
jgi:hypothetical protein